MLLNDFFFIILCWAEDEEGLDCLVGEWRRVAADGGTACPACGTTATFARERAGESVMSLSAHMCAEERAGERGRAVER